ncbi:aldo/keto reductase [Arenicella xantha]|uniref:NADP-dependent oxidoreductase domain-containing protein n=1 Tax=Arenicella xantha TaxID=644221 RepID=A0A395JFU8_9GAMM|nr:aldo/keto reductase [Arenicella xantha]RBP47162.1 hypothetical protein DFR28_10934 [Arenicella xantha]
MKQAHTTRQIGGIEQAPIGLGCMNLSHAYGKPPSESESIELLHRALELGVTHFDTAALYGFGKNETLLGRAFKGIRPQIHLASKCGMTGVDGKRVIDGRPETLHRTIDAALTRLNTDAIDLYYLHRIDPKVPIEDSVGAMSDMVQAGKVRAIGLSEASADSIRRAHAVHPITALQTEYSLWSRNAEIAVLDVCRELDITFTAFSPLARGFLANGVTDVNTLLDSDIRKGMPRFQPAAFTENLKLLAQLNTLAIEVSLPLNQLALAWLLHQGEHIIPIPGTTSVAHLESNIAAAQLSLDDAVLERLDAIVNHNTVTGARYPAPTQLEIDTEEFLA